LGNDPTLYSFDIIATDPTDNNPFNGVGQTNIEVYAKGSFVYSYIKGSGGYSDNYINFTSSWRSAVDNVAIENLNLTNTTITAFSDSFTSTGTTNTYNLSYNAATRQTGTLRNTNWVGFGNAQVGNATGNVDGGNYLLVASNGSAALDRNLNGTTSKGGLQFSFNVAPNLLNNSNQTVWGSFNLGLSAANKNVVVNAAASHFGILFQSNGKILAFDGSTDITSQNLVNNPSNSWGATSSGSTLYSFSVVVTDPTDNNPFDAVGQTNIDVYSSGSLICSYIKRNGGYSDNYINFGGSAVAAVDNFTIQQLNIGTSIITFAENGIGTVYTASAIDPNGGSVSYQIAGFDSQLFNINSSTGAITFKNAPNYEALSDLFGDNIYDIQVIATSGLLQTSKAFSLQVTDANDAPRDIALSSATVLEGSAIGTIIGNLITTDEDRGNTFTYALVSGTGSTDNALFSLSGNQIKVNTVTNFESKSSYSIRVRTTDQGGLSFEKALTVTVLDINEAPTDIIANTSTISENVAPNAVVASLNSLDPDRNNTFTYTLVSGTGATDNSLFSISGNQLKINASPNREVKSSYSIRLRSTDQGGLSYEKAFTLNVGDRNEAPTFALLTDNFTATGNPNTYDLTYNLANRQGGSLINTNWVRVGNAQVGNGTAGIDSGNYLLAAYNGTAALERNFNGINSLGGLKISFNLAPNSTNLANQGLWGGINLGLPEANKNAYITNNISHFGILFRGNGVIRAFDGSRDVTSNSLGSYQTWGATGNSATLYPFTLIATDPTDGNPFDGIGQTNIYVYADKTLIFQYVKGSGGYSNNYINFGSSGISGFDDLKIEKLGLA